MEIGIIGGADGPTSIYIASGGIHEAILLAGVVVVAAVILIRIMRKKRK
jgi:Na+-transporting methylmalonyl-CoA/oxaloacetate decarboxylase beta subunit